MIRIIKTEKKPIKLWLKDIDQDTLAQAKNLANHPFLHHHVAIMPDAHVGYGMPIGGVAAMKDVVVPNAVGVDIGCGVCAVQSSLKNLSPPHLKKIVSCVRQEIPLGFKHHKRIQTGSHMPAFPAGAGAKELPVVSREYDRGLLQLGTLGGGNHFIEFQHGDDGYIWLMIHSGSRNIGYQVAHHYNKLARELNSKATRFYNRNVPLLDPKWQLDYLPLHSDVGQCYLQEMKYCVQFAAANRRAMLGRVCGIMGDFEPSISFSPILDVAHNYAALEYHFGEDVMVHRKGATRAIAGETGIIPGSQGSSSFIVSGLGDKDSFHSCSHGAGRKLGRKQAIRQLDFKEEVSRLKKQDVLHSIRNKKDLDEAPGAYKDITVVMSNQRDLVDIRTVLKPLAVVKG